VLVTGATGSLGSHIVACLGQLQDVHTIVCLNRLSNVQAVLRQQMSLEARGILLDSASMSKLKVVDTDTSKPKLGLSSETYDYLVNNVTHIIHSAWPMSLTRPIRGYEMQFRILKNLVDLAHEATRYRPSSLRFGFQFISSIAVVANYPLLNGKVLVPERPTTVESVPQAGYAEAKLICEHILAQTLHRYPDRFDAMVVRIAQISGSTTSGCWNPNEYIPLLIKSSQVLRVLPDLEGTLSWYPVDKVAATLGELLMSTRLTKTEIETDLIYHIDNPSRQPWKAMITTLARMLDIPITPQHIIPYEEWITKVRRFRSSSINDNPALQLITFFENYFVNMSCGGLLLDVKKTIKISETMREMREVNEKIVKGYIEGWKRIGVLNI